MGHFHDSVLETEATETGIMLLGSSKKISCSLSSEEHSHHLLQFICKTFSSVIAGISS